MLLGKTSVIFDKYFFKIAAYIVHHNEYMGQVLRDNEVQKLNRMLILLHLSELPQNLYLAQDSLKNVSLSFFVTRSYIFDGDRLFVGSFLGPNNNATSTLADDFVYLISIFDQIPFFGQFLSGFGDLDYLRLSCLYVL